MFRKIPLVAALLAAVLVIPATAAAADSGLTPSPSPFTYGGIPAGQSYYNAADPIVLTNNTGSDVTLSAGVDTFTSSNDGWGLVGVGGAPYPSCVSLSPVVVAPAGSCTVVPYAVWKGTLGDTTATLTVHSDQGTTDIPVSAAFQASVAQYLPNGDSWFPRVVGPAAKTHTFHVKNDGNIDLHTTSVTLLDGQPLEPSFRIVSDGCSGAPVAPGATCPITVSFDGPSDWKVGTELVVSTDATNQLGAGPTLQFDMTGVRISLAVLSHALSAHRFTPVDANGNTHGVRYTFKTTTPAQDTIQVVNGHGRVREILDISKHQAHRNHRKPPRDLARPQQLRTPRHPGHLPLPRPPQRIPHHPLRRTRPHHGRSGLADGRLRQPYTPSGEFRTASHLSSFLDRVRRDRFSVDVNADG